jgi:tetratricopeptide (TPR) repeat protein
VGGEEVLTRRRTPALAALVLCVAFGAFGQDEENDSALRTPARLTVGAGEQFLGQRARDGKSLVFVSNRNTVTEIYLENTDDGRDHRLFDEGADVTWPRVSPDAKRLLYVSFRDTASGELCVRDLPSGENRHCLMDGGSPLQAEWVSPSRIALVSRGSIQGDLRVLDVAAGASLSAKPWIDRNLTNPAISPDGRWMVYVPIERTAQPVGPGFAAHASAHLEARRLDRPDDPPVSLALDLPGQTGQPAFSRDGRWLYVAQFLTDSNRDGVIDAGDAGVLFRVPFPQDRDDAPKIAAASMPDQLTEQSWSCEYPAPASHSLVATCQRDKSLDVYELPLDGETPEGWKAKQVDEELAVAARPSVTLLLLRQRLARETDPHLRRELFMRLAQAHLDNDDFGAATFYAEHMAGLLDAATHGLWRILKEQIEHRHAMRERERARPSEADRHSERTRLESLHPEMDKASVTRAFTHLVRSEIAQDLGDFKLSREEFAAALVDAETPPPVLRAYFERADALFRALDEPAALIEVCRSLAANAGLSPDEQLGYAQSGARALVRGRALTDADAALDAELAKAPPDSEWAFALELQRDLIAVHDDAPTKPVMEALVALYKRQTRPGRRRAVVLDASERADRFGAEKVVERLADPYLTDSSPGTQERRQATSLFRRALTGRAYRLIDKDKLDKAMANFDAVTQRTGSFTAAVEAINLRRRAHESPEAIEKEVFTKDPAKAEQMAHFVKAYVLARELPKLQGDEHAKVAAEAMAELRADWTDLKKISAAQAIYGAIAHEDFLRNGDPAAAERANRHYLVALELVRSNVRYRAMLLGELGVLHTQVGNWHIALGYLDERSKLPFADNGVGLSVKLARARALLHVGREAEAADDADQAVAMVDQKPKLAPYLPLVVDRDALYNLAAGRFERALALYDRELPLLAAATDATASRNRMLAHLARAAAAIGAKHGQRAIDDLAEVDRALADASITKQLSSQHTTPEQVLRTFRMIATGLRAHAENQLGHLELAGQALEQRRALFVEQLAGTSTDDGLRAMSLVDARLAQNAIDRGDPAHAAHWVSEGLHRSDDLVARTHAPVDAEQLDLLWFAAELESGTRAKLDFDLAKRLGEAQKAIGAARDPAWRSYQAWFDVYEALDTTK